MVSSERHKPVSHFIRFCFVLFSVAEHSSKRNETTHCTDAEFCIQVFL